MHATAQRRKKVKEAIIVGLFGAIIWNLLGYVAYLFRFTSIGPVIYAKPFLSAEWEKQPLGHLAGIGVFSIFSILFALFYVFFFSKYSQPWIGIAFGVVLWSLFFLLIGPMFALIKPVAQFDVNTIVTQLSLYILYGLFVGYSLSVEFSGQEI